MKCECPQNICPLCFNITQSAQLHVDFAPDKTLPEEGWRMNQLKHSGVNE